MQRTTKYILVSFFVFFTFVKNYAQELRVLDAQTHQPIEHATIFTSQNQTFQFTDHLGRIVLNFS